ncbi:MAG TPA: hypothetical protein VHG89_02525 [Verrucomicrobiae bacterium]|nr:hypothetical protein [Verrucomicrobiae bacterium]
MKKTINSIILLIGLTVAPVVTGQSFVNLDFEQANVSGYSPGDSVPASDAIPGWTAYTNGAVLENITYDTGFGVAIEGTNGITVQGYSIHLAGSKAQPAAIGQVGAIPITAQSLIFDGIFFYTGADTVSFNGQALTVQVIGQTSSYNVYGADISAFAGQTGQLLFTDTILPSALGDRIDNIQFSSSPIPEPSASWLVLIGSGIFFYVRHNRKLPI